MIDYDCDYGGGLLRVGFARNLTIFSINGIVIDLLQVPQSRN